MSREQQDNFALESQARAARAQVQCPIMRTSAHMQAAGKFDREIVPTTAIVKNEAGDEGTVVVTKDDGVRPTTLEVPSDSF